MNPNWLNPRSEAARMMYLIHPHLMKDWGDVFEELARKRGYEPFNPFAFERGKDGKFRKSSVEDSLVKRGPILKLGLAIQSVCGATAILGISEGCMGETRDRLRWDPCKNIHVWRYGKQGKSFDSEWDEKYEKLKNRPEYGDVLADIRGINYLFPFIGPSAIGKTYWLERLRGYFGNVLSPVKNVTTRPPRDGRDLNYYYQVSRKEFEFGKKHGVFWEYDEYADACYGSSIDEARKVLKNGSGIFALTPSGAKKWYERRLDINMRLIVLKPASDSVLIKNFKRRNEIDEKKVSEKLKKAKEFVLPASIKHTIITITGEEDYDRPRVFDAIRPFIK